MRRAENQSQARHRQAEAALMRDHALARVSRVRRWTLAGAAALTAALAALASALVPGKSLGAKARGAAQARATPTNAGRSTAPPLPTPASGAQLGLEGPAQAPQSAQAPPSAPSTPDPSQSATPAPAPAPAAAPPAAVSGGS